MFEKNTPLTDIVSPLPPELGELVLRLVRRTKLWPGEKRDLARELTAHFLDGLATLENEEALDTPAAAKQLASKFGDERTAAKLIRRSKKRCRPLPWKAFVFSVRTCLVAFGSTALFAGWRMTGSANPRINYIAQLNAATESIPESDRAWPLYREAIEQFHGPWRYDFFKTNRKHWYELMPDDDAWPEVRQWLNECHSTVDLLRLAGNRPALGAVYSVRQGPLSFRHQYEIEQERIAVPGDPSFEEWLSKQTSGDQQAKVDSPMMLQVLLPYISVIRDMSRMMVLRSLDNANRGNIIEATDDLLIVVQMANHQLAESILVCQVIGAACAELAHRGMCGLLAEHGEALSKNALQKMAHAWAAGMPIGSLRLRPETERTMFIDVIQHVFTENPWGDGHVVLTGSRSLEMLGGLPKGPFSAEGLGVAVMHAGRKRTLQKFDEIWATKMEWLSKPLYSADRRSFEIPEEPFYENRWNRARYAVIMIMLPSLSNTDERIRRTAMDHEATLTVIALTAYRNENGHYPEQLTDLVPAYLPKLPEDIYDGQPLKYRLNDKGEPLLYSIWADFTDDGGTPRKKPSDNAPVWPGDWGYLPTGLN